jgi:ABC-type transport system involved in multi-copper enzyme maturation permease subunit
MKFKSLIVAKFTYLELYKSKILLNVVLLALGLLGISIVATEFTYGVPSRVAIDFGLGSTSLSSLAIAIFMGSNLLLKEMENRTLYMILSRSISRFEFLLGRVLGLLLILLLNIFILMSVTLCLYFYLGGAYSDLIIWNFIYTFLECSIVLLVVILFSMITNQTIAIINTITVLVAGHAIGSAQGMQFARDNSVVKFILKLGEYTLPNFEKINIKSFLVYKETLPTEYLLTGLAYGLVYLVLLLSVAILIFKRKSLD